VLDGLASYERRRGWRGHLLNVLAGGVGMDEFKHPDWNLGVQPGASYAHALVTGVLPYQVTGRIGQQRVTLSPEDWAWTGYKTADEFLKPGDIIYVHVAPVQDSTLYLRGTLEQDSGAEGSLLAMDNATGDVLAMVGGRDFNLSQFNRATQAERQTGSSFKPYVYTAAVEQGANPREMIVDSPVSFGSYVPHNYDGKYLGSISLLHAFADSRNIPALKLAEHVGIRKVIDVAHRFGISSNIPAYLPVALGSVEVTLEEQVAAYSSFPNDGIRIAPRLIRRVTSPEGTPMWMDTPDVREATSTKTARTMMVFLKEVTAHGTGAAAAALKHPLGGKTGTTNDFTDAWFLGFSPSITCGTWVGFDNRESLGEKETGARAALPIWMDFMRTAIAGKDDETFPGETKAEPSVAVASNSGPAPLKSPLRPTAPAKPLIR
jgi:penicillin-binding protein 1A